ncbi:MAG: zf-HC2 domain-containing protein [Anaerolineae bacterium]|nr:zf-HC2 domain-containing protein [Anaerolineae bacterium]
MTMTCAELIEQLSAYLDDELSEELTASAQEHLATCENCSVVLDTTRKTILLFREKSQVAQIPAARKNHLYAQIATAFHTHNE